MSFSPKAYDTRVTSKDKDGNEVHACDDKRVIDPALKESALLTGVFNRLARSCFYGVAVKEGDESPYRNGCIPAGAASATVVEAAEQAALAFEQAMYKFETHRALAVCDDYCATTTCAPPTSAGATPPRLPTSLRASKPIPR